MVKNHSGHLISARFEKRIFPSRSRCRSGSSSNEKRKRKANTRPKGLRYWKNRCKLAEERPFLRFFFVFFDSEMKQTHAVPRMKPHPKHFWFQPLTWLMIFFHSNVSTSLLVCLCYGSDPKRTRKLVPTFSAPFFAARVGHRAETEVTLTFFWPHFWANV